MFKRLPSMSSHMAALPDDDDKEEADGDDEDD